MLSIRGVSTPEPPESLDEAEAESHTPTAPAYARAGVDLDRDEGFVDDIAAITRPTMRPEILSPVGGFAGLFKAPERYKNPIFVACNDGVGTKLKLAAELERYDTVGIDCVAMVVNDMIVQGAEPVIFLDYLAMSKLDRQVAADAQLEVVRAERRRTQRRHLQLVLRVLEAFDNDEEIFPV